MSPDTIVDIVGRHHARCFDHARGRCSYFVLARVVGTNFDRVDIPAYIDGGGNREWHTRVKLSVYMADPASSPAAMLDFGITETSGRIIGTWIMERLQYNYSPDEIGVFVHSASEVKHARAAVKLADVRFVALNDRIEVEDGAVAISTMHVAKGLELRAAVVTWPAMIL